MPETTWVGLQDHACSAWCQPPEHAHVVLITATVRREEDILHSGIANAYYALHQRRIIRARRAVEVDLAQLIQEKSQHVGISSRLTVRRYSPAQLAKLEPWLITFIAE